MATLSDGTTTWSYTYNADGLRTKRTNGTTTYNYVYNGSQLTQMTVGADTLYFSYDASGRPMTVTHNGTVYHYVLSLQGDVILILDDSGNMAVSYVYDAWGNTIDGYFSSTLGTLNPLRYRGYVYDTETELYYLQSRYYNPEIGRFINADAFASTGQGLLGNNMFAYCGNNPVCRYDVGGMFWEELISGILHTVNDFSIAIGIDTAAIGAFFLMMEQDDSGVYHASFNCWQQYAGYNQFYDFAFDLVTSMVAAQFGFWYNGYGYTIWAWKGDYINLGAGAELGIYRGSAGHRIVDTSLAMWMGMIVSYKNEEIINYFPNEDQWWITGFNPKYQNVDANDLFVTIGVGFNNSDMYYAFKRQWGGDSRWAFADYFKLAILIL